LDAAYPTFPQPIGLGAGRTAFYAQTNSKAKYTEPTPSNRPRTDIQSVAGPDRQDQIGGSVHESVMEATTDPTPSRRDVLGVDNHPASFDPNATFKDANDRN